MRRDAHHGRAFGPARLRGEDGFTLIELLVVILIIGILAAIAIPAFLNQRGKSQDASAKTLARSAQTALETCSQDFGGKYDSCTRAKLIEVEPTLNDSRLGNPTLTTSTYTITVTSDTGKTVTIGRSGGGITRGGTVGSW